MIIKEKNLANLGCLTVIILTIVGVLLFRNTKEDINKIDFELISNYDSGKNAEVLCVYTNSNNYKLIEEHALKYGNLTQKSVVIFYYNDKKKIPNIKNSGFIIDAKDHKNAIATYKKYGKRTNEFIIH